MRFAIVTVLLVSAIAAGAELIYLPAEGARVSATGICAVEARVALPAARSGSGKHAWWSIVWPGTEVSFHFNTTTHVDGIDDPVAEVKCGNRSATIRSGFDASGGFNTLAVEWLPDGSAHILAGDRALHQVLLVDSLPLPTDSVSVTSSAPCEVADLIIETNPDDFGRLLTGYSAEELNAAPRWRYLDRENDPAVAVCGGNYELAAIAEPSGRINLVYLAGAQTNAPHWKPGMLKGRLIPTGFKGYYKLEWVDATGRRIPDECYARLESPELLNLVFPSLQASIRLALKKDLTGT